jgi:hypothetical protein
MLNNSHPHGRVHNAAGRGRFLLTGDARYAKLRPFLASAVTWFRNPFALLFVARARPPPPSPRRALRLGSAQRRSSPCGKWRRAAARRGR